MKHPLTEHHSTKLVGLSPAREGQENSPCPDSYSSSNYIFALRRHVVRDSRREARIDKSVHSVEVIIGIVQVAFACYMKGRGEIVIIAIQDLANEYCGSLLVDLEAGERDRGNIEDEISDLGVV